MTDNLLVADDITVRFGGLTAVSDVSFTIPDRSVVSLIGPNGAGKTTFFNILTGLYKPTEGAVGLLGNDITGLAPHKIAHMGLARTFQNIRLFGLMTAEENVMVAMHSHMKAGVWSTLFRTKKQKREESEYREFAQELLDFVGVVAANRRLSALQNIISAFAALVAAKRGVVVAEVHTAHPITDVQEQQLRGKLAGEVLHAPLHQRRGANAPATHSCSSSTVVASPSGLLKV